MPEHDADPAPEGTVAIDLRSDTVTRPSDAMREAAHDATVGDDVYREDPTVNELEARAADLVGMDAALYVPTGTMGNQVAARTHTERGQEALVERESHIYRWELAGLAQHAELQARLVDGGERGVVTPEAIHDGYVEADGHRPGTGLVCLENTHNAKGGTAIAADRIDAAARAAHDHGVPVHLDGARLFNAAAALDVPAARLTREVDSVMFCLSKGLGAPVGSMLAGDADFIEAARRVRKLFGGGMRQAGIIAAPGLRALENRDRLAEDHRNAARLADGLDDLDGLDAHDPETNIVLVDTEDPAEAFLERCRSAGVLGVPFDDHQVRFCTHLDVSREDVETAVQRVAQVA
ncbi:MAG: low specificity L-threonine aldolase [Haloplanus sp.]